MLQTGEDWLISKYSTGKVTIKPVLINNIIYLDIVKSHDYKHLMKGAGKPKLTNAMPMKYSVSSKELGTFRGYTHFFLSSS